MNIDCPSVAMSGFGLSQTAGCVRIAKRAEARAPGGSNNFGITAMGREADLAIGKVRIPVLA